jgi:uncharacterized protein YdeI (YjbR/CyaY-like superfamily)
VLARSFASPAAFSSWLAKNHGRSEGVWLRLAKKASKTTSLTYAEAVEVALTWGWIDGQKKRSAEDGFWLQKVTPRGPRSIWSQINREKALSLIADGRMQPPGLAQVERAKADGRWKAAYASPKGATGPPDLRAALAKNARAREFFEVLEARNRYAVLWRIAQAKKPETRAARVAKFVEMLARHEKLHP